MKSIMVVTIFVEVLARFTSMMRAHPHSEERETLKDEVGRFAEQCDLLMPDPIPAITADLNVLAKSMEKWMEKATKGTNFQEQQGRIALETMITYKYFQLQAKRIATNISRLMVDLNFGAFVSLPDVEELVAKRHAYGQGPMGNLADKLIGKISDCVFKPLLLHHMKLTLAGANTRLGHLTNVPLSSSMGSLPSTVPFTSNAISRPRRLSSASNDDVPSKKLEVMRHTVNDAKHWTRFAVFQSLGVFVVAGLFEIGGGWFIWQALKEGRPNWYMAIGCALLSIYGFIPTLQPPSPSSAFGRIFAAYGGIFIILSFLWGAIIDHMKLDIGDCIGGGVALLGVLIAWFWPRVGSVALPTHSRERSR